MAVTDNTSPEMCALGFRFRWSEEAMAKIRKIADQHNGRAQFMVVSERKMIVNAKSGDLCVGVVEFEDTPASLAFRQHYMREEFF